MKALLGAIGVIGIAGIVAAHLYGQKIEASIDQDGLARACPLLLQSLFELETGRLTL